MDRTNPSLNWQYQKMGASPFVLTQDTIPIRKAYSDKRPWEEVVQNWANVEERLQSFQARLNQGSRFILLFGKENMKRVIDIVPPKPGERVIKAKFTLPVANDMYGEKTFALAYQNRKEGDIRRVVFFVHHSMTFFYPVTSGQAARQDLIMNAFCELIGIPISWEDCFLARRVTHDNVLVGNRLKRAVRLRHQEKNTGVVFPEEMVRQELGTTIDSMEDELTLHPVDDTGSFVRRVIQVFVSRRVETERARGFPALKRGVETRRARGFPELRRSLEIRRARGFPELRRGDETRRARGFPELKRGQETLRARGLPHVKRSLEVRRANRMAALDECTVDEMRDRLTAELAAVTTDKNGARDRCVKTLARHLEREHPDKGFRERLSMARKMLPTINDMTATAKGYGEITPEITPEITQILEKFVDEITAVSDRGDRKRIKGKYCNRLGTLLKRQYPDKNTSERSSIGRRMLPEVEN
ncbi:hypothetical protein F5Y10DRAFT_256401 [Nemania abortiva]|nr:hypothetical protein F5Y10DRAFT_256401 [Nemania abortiva]